MLRLSPGHVLQGQLYDQTYVSTDYTTDIPYAEQVGGDAHGGSGVALLLVLRPHGGAHYKGDARKDIVCQTFVALTAGVPD